MTAPAVHPLAQQWREDARTLRRRASETQADVLESCAQDLEAWSREQALEALTLNQAAQESGYSYSALEKMVREGRLPNVGSKGAPRVRRANLPRKGERSTFHSEEPGLAQQILQSRTCNLI